MGIIGIVLSLNCPVVGSGFFVLLGFLPLHEKKWGFELEASRVFPNQVRTFVLVIGAIGHVSRVRTLLATDEVTGMLTKLREFNPVVVKGLLGISISLQT